MVDYIISVDIVITQFYQVAVRVRNSAFEDAGVSVVKVVNGNEVE